MKNAPIIEIDDSQVCTGNNEVMPIDLEIANHPSAYRSPSFATSQQQVKIVKIVK